MAGEGDPKIRIPIELPPGDLSGIEQAKQGIAEVSDAAHEASLEAQRDADVLAAKQKKAAREEAELAKDTAEQVGKLVNIERAKAAAAVAGGLYQFAAGLREISAAGGTAGETIGKVATGVEGLAGAANGAAQGFAVGGPLGAAVGGMIGLLGGKLKSTINDTLEDLKALEESNKNAVASEKRFQDTLRERRDTAQTASIAKIFDADIGKLKELNDEIERGNKLLASRQSADAAKRETANQEAVAGGANAGAVNANEEINRALIELENSRDKIADAAEIAGQAEKEAIAAEQKVKTLSDQNRITGEEFDKLTAEATALRDQATTATKDLEDLKQTEADERVKLIEAVKREFAGFTEAAGKAQADEAAKVIETIEAKGGELTGLQKQSLDTMVQAVKDGIIKPEELAPLKQALQNFSNSSNTKDKEVIETIRGAVTAIDGSLRQIGELKVQVQDLNRRAAQ